MPPPVEGAFLSAQVGWKARRQQRLLQTLDPAGLQTLAVQPGALTLSRSEEFLPGGIEDDADNQLTGYLQANGDAIERAIMDVVGRAVERIDDPGRRCFGIGPGSARGVLFAEGLVAGEQGVKILGD